MGPLFHLVNVVILLALTKTTQIYGREALPQHTTRYSNDTLVNRAPFIMSHDAGTGYLSGDYLSHPVNAWARTQSGGGLKEQLSCGARVFDVRLEMILGSLVFHHGAVPVDHLFEDALSDVIAWAKEAKQELVLLKLSHYGVRREHVERSASVVLEKYGVKQIVDCSELDTLTIGRALEIGATVAVNGGLGGSILAVHERCFVVNYNPSLTCRGFSLSSSAENLTMEESASTPQGLGVYRCWAEDPTSSLPQQRTLDYLSETSNIEPRDGKLAQLQGLWQQSGTSISLGSLDKSSIIEDTARSGLGGKIVAALENNRWKHINLLEVDDVCSYGDSLFRAIRNLPTYDQKKLHTSIRNGHRHGGGGNAMR